MTAGRIRPKLLAERSDRGYEVIVAADACAALSEPDHGSALEPLALWYGRVAPTDAIAAAMGSGEELASLPVG